MTNYKTFLSKFEQIIKLCRKCSRYLVISLNANVKPSVEEIKIILQKYGSVEIKSRKHNYQISGKKNKIKCRIDSNNKILILYNMMYSLIIK